MIGANPARHEVLLGAREHGRELRVPPYGVNLLLAGSSGSGKSTLATALLERLVECGYQVCIVDPEGNYDEFEPAINLGSGKRAPLLDEVREVLDRRSWPGRPSAWPGTPPSHRARADRASKP